MTNPFRHHPRSLALWSAIAVVLLLPVAGSARAQTPTLAFCTNGVPPCDPDKPPKPGEPGCYRPPPACPKCERCRNCQRSPNHVSSGEYSANDTDLSIPTNGFSITVSRLYQSTRLIDGDMGYGWVSSLSARLYYAERQTTAEGGKVLEADVRLPNGALYRFIENGDKTFTPPEGVFDTLVRNADGTWDYRLQGTGARFRYSSTGNLLEMVDGFGHTLVWTYVDDRLSRITDTSGSGRFIGVDWGADGRISDVTDLTGRNVRYTYVSGRLTAARNPAGQSTHYGYGGGKYVPLLASITDHWNRNVTTITRDAGDDRVKSYTEHGETYTYEYGYGGVATTTAKKDSSGNLWVFPFDEDGLVTADIPPGGGPAVHRDHDQNGLVQLYTDATGVKSRYTYDVHGNVVTAIQDYAGPNAVEWRYVYDANFPGKVTSRTPYKPGTNDVDPDWKGSRYDYYPPGSVAPGMLHHVYDVDDSGMGSRVTWTYTYDSHGRRLTETAADGGVRSLTYSPAGDVERIDAAANNQAGVRPYTTYTHDALGRLVTATDPEGNVTTYTWDVLNRPTSRTDPPPTGTSTLAFITRMEYDELEPETGWLISRMVGPDGIASSVAVDTYGRVVRETDAAQHTVRFTWEKGFLKAKQDENDQVTLYDYDVQGRLRKVTYPDATFEEYSHRADGKIGSFRDRAGTVVTYDYDAVKRLTLVRYPDGSRVEWTYKGQNLMKLEDTRPHAAGVLTRTWDEFFRIRSETQGDRGRIEWTYDTAGRVFTETIDGGAATTYGYYPDGSLRTIGWSPVPGSFEHEYDLSGRLTKIRFPNAQTRTSTYDRRGRITSVANVHPSGNLATFSYEHDVDAFTGESSQPDLLTGTTTWFPALSMNGAVTRYGYDARGMLIRAEYPAGAPYHGRSAAWSWDAAGNRTSATVDGTTSTYTYRKYGANPLNGSMLLSDGANTYSYDQAGSTRSRSGARGSYTFGWDADQRLVSVSGDESESYRYDLIMRRATTVRSGAATNYLYSGFSPVVESGASSAQYLFGAEMDRPLAMVREGQVYYYDVDRLGSVVALNDASGAIVNAYAYDAWGATIERQEAVANPFGYTARPRAAAGLTEHRFRHYEPASGSFRSLDPLIGLSTRKIARGLTRRAVEMAAYQYAGARPTMLSDPFGLTPRWPPNGGLTRKKNFSPEELDRFYQPQKDCNKYECDAAADTALSRCAREKADGLGDCLMDLLTGLLGLHWKDMLSPGATAGDCFGRKGPRDHQQCLGDAEEDRQSCYDDCERKCSPGSERMLSGYIDPKWPKKPCACGFPQYYEEGQDPADSDRTPRRLGSEPPIGH
jgi:RHS repeat-associated protein